MALKATSSPIALSTSVTQAAASTFEVVPVDLQLNPLDNEVFVVTAVKIDYDNLPTATPGPNVFTQGDFKVSICKSRPAAMQSIGSSNCIAASVLLFSEIYDGASNGLNSTFLENSPMDTPPADQMYLDIVATDNFFIALDGTNTSNALEAEIRVYGYRARADASTYAALVQSEVLSA